LSTGSTEVVFLDKDTKNLSIKNKAIIVLSPSFYWFVKKEINNLSLNKAKKIAPSVFDEIGIPKGEYSYHVEKVGEKEFWFFAYNDKEILDKLNSLGIKPSQISKIYPAQLVFQNIGETPLYEKKEEEKKDTTEKSSKKSQENSSSKNSNSKEDSTKKEEEKPPSLQIKIGNQILIKTANDKIIKIPSSLFNEKEFKDTIKNFQDAPLSFPKHSLPLKTYSFSFISEELLFKFSLITFLFILAYAVEIFLEKRDLSKLISLKNQIMQKYNLPPTSIQIRSIINSLHKVQKEQLKLRDQLDAILRLPLLPGENLLKVDFGKEILFEVALTKPKRAEVLKNYLVRKLQVTNMRVSGNILQVKCKR